MKKITLIAIPLIALTFVSCTEDGTNEAKQFISDLKTAISSGDSAAISQLYPDALKADSLALNIIADSVKVEKSGNGDTLQLLLGDGKRITLLKTGDNAYQAQSSIGLFVWPEKEVAFAKQTGQWKDGLTDAEQAERMADKGLVTYLFDEFNAKVKDGLSILNVKTYGDDYYEGEWVSCKGMQFTVKNNTDIDIPGSAWSITYKEGYWGGGEMASELVPGEDIKAGGTVTVKTKKLASSTESETTQRLNVKGLTLEEFLADFHPSGKEYDEYVKSRGSGKKPTAKAESLEFVLEGLMGGCGTRLCMYGQSGNLLYSPNSKSLDTGSNEQRNVNVVSYDPATAHLVIRVSRIDGTVTGHLDGTYRDGVYEGKFKNTNGKSSSFSFR